jgi:hypothetical protein
MLYNIPTTTPIRPANTPPSRMPKLFLSPSLTGTGVGVERLDVGDVAAFWGVVPVCVPEDKLTEQVLGVGQPVHVQVSGHIESVRKIVEVTVTVVVGGMEDVGGGLEVKVEPEVEDDEVLTVEVEPEVEDEVEVEDDGEVGDDEVWDDEVWDDEVWDDEVWDDEVWDDEVWDDEVWDDEVWDDTEVGDDTDVGQGGYNTIVVVAHPVRQAVSQAVVV